MPDEATILRFRHLLERHQLAPQMLAAINTGLAQQGLAPSRCHHHFSASSTKNKDSEQHSEMLQTKKGDQWHLCMKAHIGVNASSGLVHTVMGKAANANDVTQAGGLLHDKEKHVWGDAGYQGVDKPQELQGSKTNHAWPCAGAEYAHFARSALESARWMASTEALRTVTFRQSMGRGEFFT